MSFHIRKLAVRPPVKFKQATLSISLNKTDILLPYYISKVHSMFPLGISLETIIVAIFFSFCQRWIWEQKQLKSCCVVTTLASPAESARLLLHMLSYVDSAHSHHIYFYVSRGHTSQRAQDSVQSPAKFKCWFYQSLAREHCIRHINAKIQFSQLETRSLIGPLLPQGSLTMTWGSMVLKWR